MKSLQAILAVAALAVIGSPVAAQMTNSMGGSMGNMGKMSPTPMPQDKMPDKMASEHKMMSMHHKRSSKMAMCHGMSHRGMMHNRKCAMMMKHHHHAMIKHGM